MFFRRGRISTELDLSNMELRGTEVTLRHIETRLVNALSNAMDPFEVGVHVVNLSPLRWVVNLGPPGRVLAPRWWDFESN